MPARDLLACEENFATGTSRVCRVHASKSRLDRHLTRLKLKQWLQKRQRVNGMLCNGCHDCAIRLCSNAGVTTASVACSGSVTCLVMSNTIAGMLIFYLRFSNQVFCNQDGLTCKDAAAKACCCPAPLHGAVLKSDCLRACRRCLNMSIEHASCG